MNDYRVMKKSLLGLVLCAGMASPASADTFPDCLARLRGPALAAGISAATFDGQTAGLTADMTVLDSMNKQPEFKTPIWDYWDCNTDDHWYMNTFPKWSSSVWR